MSTYRVSWAKGSRRVGPYFRHAGALKRAEARYVQEEQDGRRDLQLSQGSRILRGFDGRRLVNRDGQPVREVVKQTSLWEGE